MKLGIAKAARAGVAVLAGAGMLGFGVTAFPGASSASTVAVTGPLFVDVVTATSSGQLENVFTAGSEVEFWVKVYSPSTGDTALTSKELRSVIVTITGVTSLRATYGRHGADSFWEATWAIPASKAAGVLAYSVRAGADDGVSGSYVPFNVSASSLTVAS